MRRNDRVLHLPSGRMGIVYGRKGGEVCVHWGTLDKRPVATWIPKGELILDSPAPEIVLP